MTILANDNIRIENSNIPNISSSSSIAQVKENENIIISRPANHNEISIMENDWKLIRNKVNKIKIQPHLNLPDIIIGAFIPYCIDIIVSYATGKTPNYFPAFICIVLYILIKWLSKKFLFLTSDNTDTNIVHLQELNELLDQADSSKTN